MIRRSRNRWSAYTLRGRVQETNFFCTCLYETLKGMTNTQRNHLTKQILNFNKGKKKLVVSSRFKNLKECITKNNFTVKMNNVRDSNDKT